MGGEHPGQLQQAAAAVAVGRSPAAPAEQTVCRNRFLSLQTVWKSQIPLWGQESRVGLLSPVLGFIAGGRCKHCPKETLLLECERVEQPKTPHTCQHLRTAVPRDGGGEDGTSLSCAGGSDCRDQPQQRPAPSPARPGSARLQLSLATAAEIHHQTRIVCKNVQLLCFSLSSFSPGYKASVRPLNLQHLTQLCKTHLNFISSV